MALPKTSGRYRILERVAAGGMGEIYRARLTAMDGAGRDIALKLIRPRAALDPKALELFVSEVKVAMTLSHANVVQSFDVGQLDDRLYLAMEFVEGLDLARLMKLCREHGDGLVPRAHAIYAIVEAAKGLDYAHRRSDAEGRPLSIVHRDVSPGNILVSTEGEVKVADFGVATHALRDQQTQDGSIKGKVLYMAPEQLQGKLVDRRADVYSLGACLYEVLTGRRLFEMADSGWLPLVTQICEGRFEGPSAVVDGIDDGLEQIVLKALATDPDERYASASELRRDLERYAVAQHHLLSSAALSEFLSHLDAARLAPADDARADAFDELLDAELLPLGEGGTHTVLSAVRRSQEPPEPVSTRQLRASGDERARAAVAVRPVTESVHLPVRPRPLIFVIAAGVAVLGALAFVATANLSPNVAERPTPAPPPPQQPADLTPGPSNPGEPDSERASPPASEATDEVEVSEQAEPASSESIRPSNPEERPRSTKRSNPRPDPEPTTRGEPAVLSINSDPWTLVTVDGASLGETPIAAHRVSPGQHVVVLRHPPSGAQKRVVVHVTAGERRRIVERLR